MLVVFLFNNLTVVVLSGTNYHGTVQQYAVPNTIITLRRAAQRRFVIMGIAPAGGQILVPRLDGVVFASIEEVPTSKCFREVWIRRRDQEIDRDLPKVQPARGPCTFSVFEFSDWMKIGDALAIALDLPNDHSMVGNKLFSEKRLWSLQQIDQLIGRQTWNEDVGLPSGGFGCVFPVVNNDVRLSFVTVHCDPSRKSEWMVNVGPRGLDCGKGSEARIFVLNNEAPPNLC